MEPHIELGMTYTHEITVTPELTAHAVGNTGAHVFSTPSMLLLIENTCWYAIRPALAENQLTVGTQASFHHLAATPVGMNVRCKATVTEVDRRRIEFEVEVYDEVEKVGEGTHERFIVKDAKKFVAQTNQKSKNN